MVYYQYFCPNIRQDYSRIDGIYSEYNASHLNFIKELDCIKNKLTSDKIMKPFTHFHNLNIFYILKSISYQLFKDQLSLKVY